MCLSWNSYTTRTLYAYKAQDDNKTPVTGTGSAGECRYQFTCSLAHTDSATPTKYLPSETHTLSNTLHTNHTHTTYLYTHSHALCCQIQLDSDKELTTNIQTNHKIRGEKTLPFDISTLIVNKIFFKNLDQGNEPEC